MKALVVEDWPQHRPFDELRDAMIAEGRKFDEGSLPLVAYDQLHLCCIGNAGEAACQPKLVRVEKEVRRERFLSMEEYEFKPCEPFLKAQGMYDDVLYAAAALAAPAWDSLSDRQKVWAKLTCIHNHADDPFQRLADAIELLKICSTTCLPGDVSAHYIAKLKAVMSAYPGLLSIERFRAAIADVADNIKDFLPDSEQVLCIKEEIRDFQCTSDCFRVLA